MSLYAFDEGIQESLSQRLPIQFMLVYQSMGEERPVALKQGTGTEKDCSQDMVTFLFMALEKI
jgi:hypothetical protein